MQACLRLRRQQRALAHLVEVREEAVLIRRELQRIAARLQIGDAAEEFGVEGDVHAVLGELRRVGACHRLERLAGAAGVEVGEHLAHPAEQSAAALHRLDGVGKARRLRIPCDGGDLNALFGDGAVEGRREMLGPDGIEGRQAERRRPALEEGIVRYLVSL